MLHARADYNRRIQDLALHDPSLLPPGSTPIGEDEPVFLMRAQNDIAPDVVRQFAFINNLRGGDLAMTQAASDVAVAMERWQERNPEKVKHADLPAEDVAADNARQQAGT